MTSLTPQSGIETPITESNPYGGDSTDAPHADARLAAIGIFLQHFTNCHEAKLDQRIVCTIASVCKEWNTAVLRAGTGHLSIKPRRTCGAAFRAFDSLSSLAIWLPKYGHLVSDLDISKEYLAPYPACGRFENPQAGSFQNMAGTLLQFSLQAAARQGMKLHSFSTNVLHSGTFLCNLPGDSLTRMKIVDVDGTVAQATLAAALLRFEHLQDLCVIGAKSATHLPALGQLSKLTSLVQAYTTARQIEQLPAQLLHLDLYAEGWQELQLQALAHMTRLTSLRLTGYVGGITQGSALPRQLLKLEIYYHRDNRSATEPPQLKTLSQLERLKLEYSCETASGLLELARLPRLQELLLSCTVPGTNRLLGFMATSSAWPQIPQLKDLHFDASSSILPPQLPTVLTHIAACTGLTQLLLVLGSRQQEQVPVDLCQHISSLHKLQNLTVYFRGDATYWGGQPQHLRPLTSLTELELGSFKDIFDDTMSCVLLSDAAMIASLPQLPQLRCLCVPVRSNGVLEVIGSLRELRHLHVRKIPCEACTWTGLSHLRELKKLTELKGCDKCSDVMVAQLWAAVRS